MDKRICPKCQGENDVNFKFCQFCGERLIFENASHTHQKKKSSAAPIIITLLVVFLILASAMTVAGVMIVKNVFNVTKDNVGKASDALLTKIGDKEIEDIIIDKSGKNIIDQIEKGLEEGIGSTEVAEAAATESPATAPPATEQPAEYSSEPAVVSESAKKRLIEDYEQWLSGANPFPYNELVEIAMLPHGYDNFYYYKDTTPDSLDTILMNLSTVVTNSKNDIIGRFGYSMGDDGMVSTTLLDEVMFNAYGVDLGETMTEYLGSDLIYVDYADYYDDIRLLEAYLYEDEMMVTIYGMFARYDYDYTLSNIYTNFIVTLTPSEDSVYGYNIIETAAWEAEPIPVTSTSETSYLPKQGNKTYDASKVIDGDFSTVWSEGVPGLGQGEEITLYFDEPTKVSAVKIFGGHKGSQELMDKNSYPYQVCVTFSSGNYYYQYLNNYVIPGTQDPHEQSSDILYLYQPETTDYVKIRIEDSTLGSKYDDTCISEVLIY